MRAAPPFPAFLTSVFFLASCSGGLPTGVGTGQTSTTPGASSAPPIPAFSVSANEGVAPFQVTFEQLDTTGTTSWKWDFGDGASCESGSTDFPCSPEPFAPTHTYTTAGVFAVVLTARGPGGTRVARVEDAVEVRPTAPVAAFSPSTTGGILPLPVTFTNQSSNATSFLWNFGDGATSTLVSPSHTYTQFGTFNAELRATGPGGNSESARAIVVQAPPPNPGFVAQVNGSTVTEASGPFPLAVRFVQTNTAFTTSRLWQFGDGATSTQESPTHTYSTPGLFDVTLSVDGPGGVANLTRPDLVETFDELADGSFEAQASGQAPSGPWTSFSGHLGGVNGHRVLPAPSPATDVGMPTNGIRWCAVSSQTSANTTPPSVPGGVTSPAIGAAGVRQAFSYRNGQSRLKFDAVFVTGETPGSATFRDWASVDVSDGTTTRNLFFSDTLASFTAGDSASIPGTQFSTAPQSINVDLSSLFPASTVGTLFTLTAQAGNVGGALRDSFLFIDNVRLELIANPVVANFTASPVNANLNQGVTFTDTSTGSPTAWAWEFGDGGTATTQNPVRIYTTTGPKTVRLTASKSGSSDTLTRPDFINVFGTPNASFTRSPASGRAPLLVTLDNTSSNVAGVTFTWNFGDGATSNASEPGSHTYRNTTGADVLRTITLTARTPTSPQLTAVATATVLVRTEATFVADIYPILNGSSCVGCHSTLGSNGNLAFNQSASQVRTQLLNNTTQCAGWLSTHNPARYVIAGDLLNSNLWDKVGVNTATGQGLNCLDQVMPTSGALPFETRDLFRSWIEAGALNN